jgi:hypothetical protein
MYNFRFLGKTALNIENYPTFEQTLPWSCFRSIFIPEAEVVYPRRQFIFRVFGSQWYALLFGKRLFEQWRRLHVRVLLK